MREESAGKVFRHGGEIATAGSLKREREMVDAASRGIGKFEPLGKDRQFVASDRLNPEQKSDFHNLQPGQILTFHRATDGISKNDSLEVVSVGDRAATVRDSRGYKKEITAKDARSFDVCIQTTLFSASWMAGRSMMTFCGYTCCTPFSTGLESLARISHQVP